MASLSSLEKYKLILPVLEGELNFVSLSASVHISVRTLCRWLKIYRTEGLKGFDRKPRKDAGMTKALSAELLELTQALALKKPPMSISSIHRKIAILSERSSQKPPSYETIYALVKNINPALKTLAIEGAKVYRQKYEMIFRRECGRSNEIWQTDHTLLDVFVLNPEGGQFRPWLTTVMDDYSRAIAGVFISSDAPSSINTALALRQAIGPKNDARWLVCGIPEILYTDHGSDFMSDHIEQVCIGLKIRMVNSAVARPQGRGKIKRMPFRQGSWNY